MATHRPLGMPQDLAGLVEAVSTIAEQDAVLADALAALGATERLLERLDHDAGAGGTLALLLWDVRQVLRAGDAARARVRPLMRRLGCTRTGAAGLKGEHSGEQIGDRIVSAYGTQ